MFKIKIENKYNYLIGNIYEINKIRYEVTRIVNHYSNMIVYGINLNKSNKETEEEDSLFYISSMNHPNFHNEVKLIQAYGIQVKPASL